MVYFLETASSTIQALNTNSGAIQAAATVVLVLITIYSATQTKQVIEEAAKSRKDSRLPILRVGIRGPGNGMLSGGKETEYIEIFLKNVGYGIARDIVISLPENQIKKVRSLGEGLEHEDVVYVDVGFSERVNKLPDSEKKIVVTYKDIFSREVKTLALFSDTKESKWIKFETTKWDPILPS